MIWLRKAFTHASISTTWLRQKIADQASVIPTALAKACSLANVEMTATQVTAALGSARQVCCRTDQSTQADRRR